MNKGIKFIEGIILDFVLLLFIYFIGRLIIFVFTSFYAYSEHDNPIVFSYFWIFLLFAIPYFVLIRRGLKKEKYFGFLFVIAILCPLSILVTNGIASIFFKIDDWKIVNSQYIGLAGMDDRESDALFEEGKTITDYSHSFVFIKNDIRVDEELEKLKSEHEDASKREFIFWQTALAEGFSPKYIPNYNCCKNFSDKLELYFTVGPLVILENFINAIKDALLFLLLPVIYRVSKKTFLFKDFKSLRQYLEHEIYE